MIRVHKYLPLCWRMKETDEFSKTSLITADYTATYARIVFVYAAMRGLNPTQIFWLNKSYFFWGGAVGGGI